MNENGKGGITDRCRELLRSVPRSKTVKLKGGAAQESGLPDFLFVCAALGGRAVFVEVKQPGEEPRKLQRYKLDEFKDAEAITAVVHSVDELELLLQHLHVIPQPRVEPVEYEYEVKRGPRDGPYGPNEVKYASRA